MIEETNNILLKVDGLVKHFPITRGIFRRQVGTVKAVDGISFEIKGRENLGLVGESGCGKSTAARVILQLLQATSGKVYFKEQEITSINSEDLRKRRPQMQMIFQDPQDSLNPRMTVGSIISEPMLEHQLQKHKCLLTLTIRGGTLGQQDHGLEEQEQLNPV